MISIITATYNNEATIAQTISALKAQQVAFEWVVQDGGSTDNTLAMIKSSGLPYNLQSEKDCGLYDALNKAIKRSKGEVIGFCHADDAFANEHVLSWVHGLFEEHNQFEAVYGDLLYMDSSMQKVKRRWKSGTPKTMRSGWMPPHPALFIKRSVFDRIGEFRTDMGSAADYEWMLRAIEFNGMTLCYLPIVLVHMRSGGMSNANLKARQEGWRGDLLAWKVNSGRSRFWPVILKKVRKLPQSIFPGRD